MCQCMLGLWNLVHYKSYILLAETYEISLQAVVWGTCLGKHYGHLDFGSDCSLYFYDNEHGNWVGAAVCASVWDP